METKAKAKFIKMSPKKVRLVVDAVRNLPVEKALANLKLAKKAAARPIMKLIDSAVANAEHNFELAKDNLFIKEIKVDEAPTLKRWMPRAHGRATTIRKRNSHISLILAEIKDSGEKKAKQRKVEAPVKLGETKPTEEKSKKEEIKDKEAAPLISRTGENKGGHGKSEGGGKGFTDKIFRRKSG